MFVSLCCSVIRGVFTSTSLFLVCFRGNVRPDTQKKKICYSIKKGPRLQGCTTHLLITTTTVKYNPCNWHWTHHKPIWTTPFPIKHTDFNRRPLYRDHILRVLNCFFPWKHTTNVFQTPSPCSGFPASAVPSFAPCLRGTGGVLSRLPSLDRRRAPIWFGTGGVLLNHIL